MNFVPMAKGWFIYRDGPNLTINLRPSDQKWKMRVDSSINIEGDSLDTLQDALRKHGFMKEFYQIHEARFEFPEDTLVFVGNKAHYGDIDIRIELPHIIFRVGNVDHRSKMNRFTISEMERALNEHLGSLRSKTKDADFLKTAIKKAWIKCTT